MKHFDIKIFGKVQGVGFRHSAKMKALELEISGFARNEPDGTVYIEAEGEGKALGRFLEWCKDGSGFAEVDKVESFPGDIKSFSDFSIK
jgi:acylphosphatase